MPAIHVRNVPEEVLASLRERAARHGRSMQQELLLILKQAAAETPAPAAPEPLRLVTVRTAWKGTFRREDIYGDEGR